VHKYAKNQKYIKRKLMYEGKILMPQKFQLI